MVEKHRTESALTGRPLVDRAAGRVRVGGPVAGQVASPGVLQAQPARQPAAAAHDVSPGAAVPDFELDVSASLETIHRVTETYAVLLDKLSSYELKVRDLTSSLGDANRGRDEALRSLARAERLLTEERDRAAEAEEHADHSAQTVQELERQLATLREQTAKLMDAVDQLFPDLEDGAADAQSGLRIVR